MKRSNSKRETTLGDKHEGLIQNVQVFKVPMASPDDASGVKDLISTGRLQPDQVVALIAKTEGNGLVDDYSRPLAELTFKSLFAAELNIDTETVAERISLVMSGGCYGLISPHVTVFAREYLPNNVVSPGSNLVIGIASSEEILPQEIGRVGQIRKVAAAVRHAAKDADISNYRDVHFVQVKGPCLTQGRIDHARRQGNSVVTESTIDSMMFSNDASALGVGIATGEVGEEKLRDDIVRKDFDLYSNVSSTSAGIEKTHADVVLLGNSEKSASRFRIGHDVMNDLIDIDGVRRAVRNAGVDFDHEMTPEQQRRVVNVFAKAVIPSSGVSRGRRFTMLNDSDVGNTAGPAIVNGIIASVVGDTMVYVSGGEVDSHSGPPGGNPVSVIIETDIPGTPSQD
jgi:cyanuric acid amidohydrolase